MSEEREETSIYEVERRLSEGTFYDDYDWASGPALRAVRLSISALEATRDQFSFYAGEHQAAGKIDKASTNVRFAQIAAEPLREYI